MSRISYTDGIQGADRVEITVANQDLRWLDHPLLQTDNGLTLALGYAPDPLEKVFTGEITGITASFPDGGMPRLTIVAHDFLHRLTTGTRNRSFMLDIPTIGQFPLPDPAVVSLVAATGLLIPEPDPVGAALSFFLLLAAYAIDADQAKRGVRVQNEQSDFDFLATVAKDNGWDFSIDHTRQPQGSVLRFRFPLSDLEPAVQLAWGRSLIDYTPRLTTVGQVAAVQCRIWIAAIKTEIVVQLGWDFDRAAFDLQIFPGLDEFVDPELGPRSRDVLTVSGGGPALAPKTLLSELLPRLNNRLTGSGSAVGNLSIKAGRVIDLQGLGEQFSGLYRITSATHTIDGGGFRTSFETRKEIWFGGIPTPRGLGGLARVNGQRIG
ncbi:hypothetical protein GCM10010112_12850 [Actinoplanes lobatus]|uniref:Uncharacterized protein n=1 Tax=Actinoplanes lobatus TaxID=113568 RepID=A0ABQ4APS5_9ACTN|nr:hypothetical protein GCM10010112_12850 [Actinoplanes lobatus]GIE43017.1 hypothetical protein Alo02nite_59150 [Actinoplanes lobatus]